MSHKGTYQTKRHGEVKTSFAEVVSTIAEAIDGAGRLELVNALQNLKDGSEAPLPAENWGDLAGQMREIAACRLLNQGFSGEGAQCAHQGIANRIHASELTLEAAESGIASAIRARYIDQAVDAYEQYAAARTWAMDHNLPVLRGTPKQRVHAELLRRELLGARASASSPVAPSLMEVWEELVTQSSAPWWLEFCGLYSFSGRRGTQIPICWVLSQWPRRPDSDFVSRVKLRMVESSKRLERAAADSEAVNDDAQLREIELEHGLKHLAATSPAQRLYARRLRARAVLEGRLIEKLKAMRSARQVIDACRRPNTNPDRT